ncbi:MAG TPA: hypothetical protein DEO70_12005 [Bacteroidales bacterium]|nr:MAG: hypothetical protein A2X11_09995 [Bacteroidetes bacterium GWE2_42_24]OFY25843.1 MAG: hypothetical protein A2X09_09370 [Bacteroidetes bacterium GWF2_43_11]HBZ67551.1 hypothetical protein [Bacteroidales bacterium]
MEIKELIAKRNFKKLFTFYKNEILKITEDSVRVSLIKSIGKIKKKYYFNKRCEKIGEKYDDNYIIKCVLALLELNNEFNNSTENSPDLNRSKVSKHQPIKYIENRAWFTCCQLNKNRIENLKDLSFLNNSSKKLEVLKTENLNYSDKIKYLYSYNSFEYIDIELNNNGLKEFNKLFMSDSKNKLFLLKIRIFDYGLLNTLSYFDIFNCKDFDSLDEEEIKLHSVVNKLNRELQLFFDLMIENEYLTKTKYLYWSVPDFVKEKELTIDASYIYQCNYFIPDTKFLNSLISGKDLNPQQFQYKDLTCLVLHGEAHIFWIGVFDKERFDYLNVNFIFLAESNVYASAFIIAKIILQYINSKKSGLDYQFRHIFNYMNEVVLAIKNTDYQKDVYDIQFALKFADLKDCHELYKDTENRIKYAIESIEIKKSQANNKFIQNIFAIFAGLTSFSVLNDVFSFLSSEKLFENSYVYVKLGLLSVIVFSVSLALYLINGKFREK